MKSILKNCNMIPVSSEGVVSGQDIILENGIICDICPTEKSEHSDAEVIDCSGKFVIPGMMDAHIHICTGDEKALEVMVACGITSVRNMWGNQTIDLNTPETDTYQLALDFELKKKLGPTLKNTSRIWDGVETFQVASRSVHLPYSVALMMDEAEKEGADQIKVYENIDYETFDYITELAREKGYKVVGHIPQKVNKRQFMNKAWSLEHTGRLELEDISFMASTPIKWVPTMIVLKAIIDIIDRKEPQLAKLEYKQYMKKEVLEIWNQMLKNITELPADSSKRIWLDSSRNYKELVRLYYAQGREVATGSDYPNPFTFPGFSVHMEMEMLTGCGASNQQALRAATVNAAHVLELEDRKGTIEIGKDADLVVLEKNPLEDIKNTLAIDKVVLLGEVLDRTKLNSILESCKKG